MKIFLTSSPSGPLDGSRKVDGLDQMNGFVDRLRMAWKSEARCLMIAASPEAYAQNDEMTAFFGNAVRRQGLCWSVFELWDWRTQDFSRERLCSYDVVFLAGGHVPTEHTFFEKIGLREKIRGFEGVLIGISAGTMNCADTIYAQPELPGEAADPRYKRYLHGLELTKTMILPHYQMVKDYCLDGMRLYEDITYGDSYGNSFLALPDGSYLLIENGEETVFGEAYRIADGHIQQICEVNGMYRWK